MYLWCKPWLWPKKTKSQLLPAKFYQTIPSRLIRAKGGAYGAGIMLDKYGNIELIHRDLIWKNCENYNKIPGFKNVTLMKEIYKSKI